MSDTLKNNKGWLLTTLVLLGLCIAIWIVGPTLELSGTFPFASAVLRALIIAAIAIVTGVLFLLTARKKHGAAAPKVASSVWDDTFNLTGLTAATRTDADVDPNPEGASKNMTEYAVRHLGCYGYWQHQNEVLCYNLPQIFQDTWHDWAQSMMTLGETKLSSDWPNTFESSPAYRFILSSGIAGRESWGGVMAPSKNSQGQPFPLCVAAALPDGIKPIAAISAMESWFINMEGFIYEMLEQEFEESSLAARLKELSADATIAIASAGDSEFFSGSLQPVGQMSIRASSSQVLHSANGQAEFFDALMQQTFFQYSLWMTARSRSSKDADTLLSAGLPQKDHGLALFSKNWLSSGCGNLILPGTTLSEAERKQATHSAMASDTPPDTLRNNLSNTIENLHKSAETTQDPEHTRLVSPSRQSQDEQTPNPATTPWKI